MRYAWVPIVVLYVFVASRSIALPGLYYDELLHDVPALAFVAGDLPSDTTWVPDSEVSLLGRRFPLMAQEYLGGVKIAAFAPVAALAGISPQSVRYFSIFAAALSLIATFAFVRRLFGPGTAAAALLLIAADPSFIAFTRVDYGPNVFMLLTKMTALWLLAVWWESGRPIHLVAACFALGVGTYDKANFIWIVAAIPLAGMAVASRALMHRMQLRTVVSGLLGFTAGAAPLIWFNLKFPLVTVGQLSIPFIAGREPNATLLERLWQRGVTLCRLLNGDGFLGWAGQATAPLPVVPVMLALAIVAVVVHTAWTGQWRAVRPFGFVLLCAALTLLASALTRGGGEVHHVILVYPLPHIIVAVGIILVARRLSRALQGYVAVASAVATLVLLGVPAWAGLAHYQHQMANVEKTGGWGSWSDAIYDLNAYLVSTAPDEDIVAVDWGIHFNLVGLSQGVLHSIDLQDPLRDATPLEAEDLLRPYFAQPGTRYVLHAPMATSFPAARRNFLDAAKVERRALIVERRVAGRDGTPVFEVYRVGGELDPSQAASPAYRAPYEVRPYAGTEHKTAISSVAVTPKNGPPPGSRKVGE